MNEYIKIKDFLKGVFFAIILTICTILFYWFIIEPLINTSTKTSTKTNTIAEIKTPSGTIMTDKIISYNSIGYSYVEIKVYINGKITTYITSWTNVLLTKEK